MEEKVLKTKVYFNRDKEENWDIEEKILKKGFSSDFAHNALYIGYEVEMSVQIMKCGDEMRIKVLKIDKVDVSDKEIYI